MVIALYRMLFASLFFGIVAARQNWLQLAPLSGASWGLGMLSGVALAGHFATWITSLSYTSVASSVVLVNTSPIFVAIGSILFLGERPRPVLYLGLVLAIAGTTIITLSDTTAGKDSLLGDMLALAGAVCGSVYLLLGRRLRRTLATGPYVTLSYSTAAVTLWLGAVALGEPLVGYPARTFGLFLLIALVPQVVGHTTFNWALKHVAAPALSVVLLGEPIGASILAFFLLDEKIGWITMAGGAIVLAGVALAIYSEKGKV